MKVAVIGAGAVGSAAARFLSQAGHEVVVFEQFERAHAKGSSHGTSRIIRKAYQDPFYAELMNEVFPLWRELEGEAQEKLYVETGILVFGKTDSAYLHSTRETLMEQRANYESLGHIDVARRFGGFHIDPDETAIFQQDAGYLRADRCIEANLSSAESIGARLRFNTRADIANDGIVNGEKYDAVAICAGSWTVSMTDATDLTPRLQTFAYFDAPMDRGIPVWIDGSESHFYGFPDYGGGFKVGRHLYGPVINPDDDRAADEDALRDIAAEARRRLGADVMLDSFQCVYTVAPNEDFRIGEMALDIPAFWASPCSGHGFKFSIWFGKLMSQLVEGTALIEDWPRFLATGSK
jgi:sarcosine oxidase